MIAKSVRNDTITLQTQNDTFMFDLIQGFDDYLWQEAAQRAASVEAGLMELEAPEDFQAVRPRGQHTVADDSKISLVEDHFLEPENLPEFDNQILGGQNDLNFLFGEDVSRVVRVAYALIVTGP